MSETLSAREEILRRIREALPGEPVDPAGSHARVERAYRSGEGLSHEACLELFLDRLIDYDTEVLQVENDTEIAGAIAEALRGANEDHVLVANEFPAAWIPSGFTFERDLPLNTAQIEAAEAVVTTCEVAVASTGTIFLVHEGAQARRVLTLLPDHHICVVRRDQIVGTVPEALSAVGARMALPVTTISGPSATSDIEMTRIRGVHGPRSLTVVLYS
jgi:L-lactate dehydrogenase complex protein LldG